MSKYTNYISEAQDLNIYESTIYRALAELTWSDTSICWPTRTYIGNITKIKKNDSITKNVRQLVDKKHVIVLGTVAKNNEKVCNLYWVANGKNNVIDDIKDFIKSLDNYLGKISLHAEIKTTLNTFLKSYPQSRGGTPFQRGDLPPSKGVTYPLQEGYRNTIDSTSENLVGADAPFTTKFKQLEPEDRIKASRVKAKPYLYDLLAGLILLTPEFDNRNFAIRGEIAAVIRTLKEIDAERGKLDADFILERYETDIQFHLDLSKTGKYSQFKTLINWLKDFGWNTERYRVKPKEKAAQGAKYDTDSAEYRKQLADNQQALEASQRASEEKLQQTMAKQNLGEKASDPEYVKNLLAEVTLKLKTPVSRSKDAEMQMRQKNAAKHQAMCEAARQKRYEA